MFFNPYNLYNPYNQSVEDWQKQDSRSKNLKKSATADSQDVGSEKKKSAGSTVNKLGVKVCLKKALAKKDGEAKDEQIKPVDWAKEHGVKSDFVMKLLRNNGVKVLPQVSKVNTSEFEKIEEAVAAEKKNQKTCSKNLLSEDRQNSTVCITATAQLQGKCAQEESLDFITVNKTPVAKYDSSQKKPLILSEEIKLFNYYIKGTVACMEKCSFPKPLLLLLKEEGRLDSEVVAEKLLQNGYLLGIAKAWIVKTLALGLIQRDENDRLSITEQGMKYLENGQCFVPKEGEWIVTCCCDKRVGNPIFSIKSLDSSVMKFNERKELSDKLKKKMSLRIDSYVKKILTSAKEFLVEGNIYMFKDVNVVGFCDEERKKTITLNWNVTDGKVWLNYDGHDLYEERLPEWARETESELISTALAWSLHYRGCDKFSQDKYGFIHVPFNKGYGSDMLMSLKVKNSINRTSAGEWDSTEISCDLVPSTEMDAKQWCNYLFAGSINKIMTKDNFETIIKDVESKMKWWKISVSDRLEYLKKLRDARNLEGRNLMLVNAVLDWQL